MKRKLLSLFILSFCFNLVYSQRMAPCYFDQLLDTEVAQNTERKIAEGITQIQAGIRSTDTVKVIPVVVHVIYFSNNQNISEEQIQSQIRILNEDYGKMPGTPGDGNGADTGIRFFLANLDPAGNCTDGIVRIKNQELAQHDTYERALLSQLSFWDPTRYLNIYVVADIFGSVLGYSSFPGGPTNEDGIVVEHDSFGDIGTANSSNKRGRTMTHEIGHWLGLYHTFHNGCGTDVCDDGDLVCDTPPQKDPHYNCTPTNSCSNDNPDLSDQVENYMDYTDELCKNTFTEGQKNRMQASLTTIRDYIWTEENLLNTGYDSVYTAPAICPISANFVALTRDICEGNAVSYFDLSLNGATSWKWYFPGAVPAVSFQANPKVFYASAGSYSASLVVENANGTDSIGFDDYIVVNVPGTGAPLSFIEDLDSGIYPPSGMSINNPDGEITWELTTEASVSGDYSIRIDNLSSTNYGTIDELILPYLDLSSLSPDSSIFLSFNYAYAKSVQSFTDELLVLLSTNCGQDFIQILYKAHNDLVTAPVQGTPFIPTADQWASAEVNLDNFRTYDNILIKFVNVTDGGNFLYLDNFYLGDGSDLINVKTDDSKELEGVFKFYPNPVRDQLNMEFTLFESDDLEIDLYNAQGVRVQKIGQSYFSAGQHSLSLKTDGLANGVYFVSVTGGQGNLVKQIIVME